LLLFAFLFLFLEKIDIQKITLFYSFN